MIKDDLMKWVEREREKSLEFYKDWEYVGEEHYIPGRNGDIRTLFYYPDECREDMPVFFDIHGGGHTVHKAEADQPLCRQLAKAIGGLVISIDYHLAPEYQWPCQIYEVYDVVQYVYRHAEQYHIDPGKMGIGGHSAGGNLTAVVTLLANEENEFSFACQLLTYPEVDFSKSPEEKYEGKAFEMIEQLKMFNRCYFREGEEKNLLYSPIYATREQLKDLPPAIMVLCDNDLLYREGLEYAVKLIESGVETTTKLFVDVVHGFTADYYYTEAGREGIEFIIQNIKRYLQ